MLSFSLQVTVGVPGGLCGPQSGPPETPCISLLQSPPRPGLAGILKTVSWALFFIP